MRELLLSNQEERERKEKTSFSLLILPDRERDRGNEIMEQYIAVWLLLMQESWVCDWVHVQIMGTQFPLLHPLSVWYDMWNAWLAAFRVIHGISLCLCITHFWTDVGKNDTWHYFLHTASTVVCRSVCCWSIDSRVQLTNTQTCIHRYSSCRFSAEKTSSSSWWGRDGPCVHSFPFYVW